jgi:acylphosphatase
MERAVRCVAHGRVQGVGFRFFVRQEAAALGVSGWVRNCADGTVEFHVEGPEGLLKDLVAAVRKGPTFGRVDELSEDWTEPSGRYTSFEIAF